jgi:serine/threonine-protein kinase
VFLSDFGLTKRASSDSGVTGTGQFVGTIDYAAPEQFEGKPLDARTDVYSLGCVLFESLTGSAPFPKEQDVARMHAHLHEAPPKVSSLRPGVPSAVDAVVARAMAKRPDHRFPRAGDLAAALERAVGAGAATPPTRGPRRAGWLAAAVSVAAAVVVLAILLLTRGGGTTRTSGSPTVSPTATRAVAAVPPGSLAEIDPRTGHVTTLVRDIPGLDRPSQLTSITLPHMAVGEGGVWAHTFSGVPNLSGANNVIHVDEATGAVESTTKVRFQFGPGQSIVVGSRTVWYIGGSETTVYRINPATDQSLPSVSIAGGTVTDLVLGGGALWVGSTDHTLTRFNALTGRFVDRISVDASPDALGFGQGSVWVLDRLANQVVRVDGRSGHVLARVAVNGSLVDLAAGDEGVWLLDDVAGTATPVDPETNSVGAPLPVGSKPSGIAVGRGFVWVTDRSDGHLYRVDPGLRDVTAFDLGAPLATLALDPKAGGVWVAVYES